MQGNCPKYILLIHQRIAFITHLINPQSLPIRYSNAHSAGADPNQLPPGAESIQNGDEATRTVARTGSTVANEDRSEISTRIQNVNG